MWSGVQIWEIILHFSNILSLRIPVIREFTTQNRDSWSRTSFLSWYSWRFILLKNHFIPEQKSYWCIKIQYNRLHQNPIIGISWRAQNLLSSKLLCTGLSKYIRFISIIILTQIFFLKSCPFISAIRIKIRSYRWFISVSLFYSILSTKHF